MAYIPGEAQRSKNPRKVTVSKVLIFTTLGAAIYLGITFAPPYWQASKAVSYLREQASNGYTMRSTEETDGEVEEKLKAAVEGWLKQKLANDTDIEVRVKYQEEESYLIVNANWTAYAKYPLTGKRTALKFNEKVRIKITRQGPKRSR